MARTGVYPGRLGPVQPVSRTQPGLPSSESMFREPAPSPRNARRSCCRTARVRALPPRSPLPWTGMPAWIGWNSRIRASRSSLPAKARPAIDRQALAGIGLFASDQPLRNAKGPLFIGERSQDPPAGDRIIACSSEMSGGNGSFIRDRGSPERYLDWRWRFQRRARRAAPQNSR